MEISTRTRGAQADAARLRSERQHGTYQRHQRVESSTWGPLSRDVRSASSRAYAQQLAATCASARGELIEVGIEPIGPELHGRSDATDARTLKLVLTAGGMATGRMEAASDIIYEDGSMIIISTQSCQVTCTLFPAEIGAATQ